MRWPVSDSSAGVSVSPTSTAQMTTIAPAVPSAATNGSPIRNRPRNATATTMPAKITARPDVVTDSTTDSSTLLPLCKPSRNRVTISRL